MQFSWRDSQNKDVNFKNFQEIQMRQKTGIFLDTPCGKTALEGQAEMHGKTFASWITSKQSQ